MKDYRAGFGNLDHEFFLGLDKLYVLTNAQQQELYIYLKDFADETRYARYSNFRIAGVEENFKITSLGNYSGNAGNGLTWNLNMQFSTPDEDHDVHNSSCAQWHNSGWWFSNCGDR